MALNPADPAPAADAPLADTVADPSFHDHGDVVEAPTWFGPAERPLFGWFVYPKSLAVRGAVVLCQPIAEESNMAHRTFRTLALELARNGFLALRFDYDGTGDSAGSFEEPGRTEAWSRSIAHAVTEARAFGVERVSLIGMRLGATLAYTAAATGELDLEELVLWDPCLSAKTFVRELQLLQSAWMGDEWRPRDDGVETPCYWFAPDFRAQSSETAIDGRTPVAALAKKTVVLFRTDRTPSPRLVEALPDGEAEWGDASDLAPLLNVPTLDAAVPRAGVADVVARLLATAPPATTKVVPRLHSSARWIEAGRPIEETARFFGQQPALFGIQTSAEAPGSSLPRLLFLNIASKRHLGEGRIWVELARAVAGTGFDSVRLDQGGVGDSTTRPSSADDVVYDEGWIDDVPFAARALSENPSAEVIAIGLCSSGTSALQAGTTGSFREVIAINVPLDVDLNRGLPKRWTVFARKPQWLQQIAIRHRRVAGIVWDLSSVILPRRDVRWVPRSIVARGTEVTLISGPEDLGRIRPNPLWRAVWGAPLRASGRFRVRALPTADHSLGGSAGRIEATDAVLARLGDYLGQVDDGRIAR